MLASVPAISQSLAAAFEERNRIFETFFAREAFRLAKASQEMAGRFQAGGRLLAFGRGACSTDAQHVSVEFVHPVIVGKRALPALDLSCAFGPWLEAIVKPDDIVMGFGPPEGDPDVAAALQAAESRGAMAMALPGKSGSYYFDAPDLDPFIHQEMVEILYHTLWETVHVFLEHQAIGQDAGDAAFLYPFLGTSAGTDHLLGDVANSIQAKVRDDAALRTAVARTQSVAMEAATGAMRHALDQGGKLILFGNGGSATDANDWALDCVLPAPGRRSIPAISLSFEPANITALANDLGTDVIFLRQLIAQARPNDIAIAISTSGGSRNVIAALEEARRRGLLIIALLGYDGGEIARRGLADTALIVSSDYIPRIQEVQASLYHFLLDRLAPKDAQHA
jgi:D-sedoheptulose 7-phosphate isomerase